MDKQTLDALQQELTNCKVRLEYLESKIRYFGMELKLTEMDRDGLLDHMKKVSLQIELFSGDAYKKIMASMEGKKESSASDKPKVLAPRCWHQ